MSSKRQLMYFNQKYMGLNMVIIIAVFEHDDIIKWKHFPRYLPSVMEIRRSPVDSPHKGQWCGALMFSFMCSWTKGSTNSPNATDLRRHSAHCVIIVMKLCQFANPKLGFERLFTHSHLDPYENTSLTFEMYYKVIITVSMCWQITILEKETQNIVQW